MFAVLHAGLAKKHRANPAAALRVEAVYGIAVLLSGLACLVLSSKEEKILDQYYKVHIQRILKLLSGRYRVEKLSGHWTPWNKEGLCTLPACWKTPSSHLGTVEAFLLSCASLSHTRNALEHSTVQFFQASSILETLVPQCLESDPVQFYLDCSTMPAVISAAQEYGEALLALLFKLKILSRLTQGQK